MLTMWARCRKLSTDVKAVAERLLIAVPRKQSKPVSPGAEEPSKVATVSTSPKEASEASRV